MKRRIFSMILALCLIISLASVGAVTAYADEYDNILHIRPRKVRIGSTVDVPVQFFNKDAFACMVLQIDYDQTALELVDVICSIADGTFLYNGDPSNPQFIWYNAEDVKVMDGSEIFYMTFKAKDDAQEGTYPITMTYSEGNVINENGAQLPLHVEAGAITVFRYLIADVNNDLLIDSADVVMLARYLVGLETEINTYGADVNEDGVINGRDLVKLARYMVGMEMIDGIIY